MATSKGLLLFTDADGKAAKPAAGAPFFAADLEPNEEVGYRVVRDAKAVQESLTFDVPAGDLLIQAKGIYGRATPEVAKALSVEPNASRPLWLTANLQQDSKWIARLFDPEWEATEDLNTIVTRTVAVEPGVETTVELASP